MPNILLMITLVIILFIIVLLYIGVKISLTYNKKGPELEGCLRILILKKIKIYSIDYPSDDEEEEEKDIEEEDQSDRNLKELFELAKPCFEHFKDFLKSFIKCIRVDRLENHLIFGLDSYADTAKYIGYIWGLLIIVNESHKNARLSAEPSFNGSIFDGYGFNEININILKLIPAIMTLLLNREVIELIRGVLDG